MLVHVSRLNEDQTVIHAMVNDLMDVWKVQASSMFEQEEFLKSSERDGTTSLCQNSHKSKHSKSFRKQSLMTMAGFMT